MHITVSWRRLLNWWRLGVWTPCRHADYWQRCPGTGFLETTYTCYDCEAKIYVRHRRGTTTKRGAAPTESMR